MNYFSHIQKWMPMQKTILYQLNTYCINSYIDCHSYLYTFNNFSSFWHISDKLFWVSFFEQITWITNRILSIPVLLYYQVYPPSEIYSHQKYWLYLFLLTIYFFEEWLIIWSFDFQLSLIFNKVEILRIFKSTLWIYYSNRLIKITPNYF